MSIDTFFISRGQFNAFQALLDIAAQEGWTVGVAGADTDLGNLIATLINQDLKAASDNTLDLGTLSLAWAFIYGKSGVGIIEGYATGFKPTGQTDTAVLFTVPTAGGKTELRSSFQTGGSIILATEP
ncbi:MAG: hypothetical protein O6761_07825 [Thaumarchaeota archaeon]|nr:hypothetical protein [Nitrososphaerota archaeon]